MKKITQVILFLFVLLITFIFYSVYFTKDYIEKTDTPIISNDQLSQSSANNLVKNLRYEVNIDQGNQYIIFSDMSEIININNIETLKMIKVTAIIKSDNKIPIIIKSDNANYNNLNHNTIFTNNVSIEYLNNKIYSEKIDLNFENMVVKITENVKYEGPYGLVKSDNIVIDLIKKKANIFMNNETEKVKIDKK